MKHRNNHAKWNRDFLEGSSGFVFVERSTKKANARKKMRYV